MSEWQSSEHRAAAMQRFGRPVAMLMIVLATIVVIATTVPFVRDALFGSGTKPNSDSRAEQLDVFTQTLAKSEGIIQGRSLFHEPPKPPAPVVRRDPPPVVERPDPGPPPPPSRYGGPEIIAMVNGQVWFDSGDKLAVGEASGGVTVLELNAPWSAKVGWSRGEYDVAFIERDSGSFVQPADSDDES